LILQELERCEDTAIRNLEAGPNWHLMDSALDDWCNHENLKSLVRQFHDWLKTQIAPGDLKALRREPHVEMRKWIVAPIVTAFVYQLAKRRGAADSVADRLARFPSVTGAFISALFGLAIHWLAFGGIEGADPKELSGDLNDMEYVIFGSLSHSFASLDKRAVAICELVRTAFAYRRQLPTLISS